MATRDEIEAEIYHWEEIARQCLPRIDAIDREMSRYSADDSRFIELKRRNEQIQREQKRAWVKADELRAQLEKFPK